MHRSRIDGILAEIDLCVAHYGASPKLIVVGEDMMAVIDGDIDLGLDHFIRFYEDGDAIWHHPDCRGWKYLDLMSGEHHHIVSGGSDDIEHFTIKESLLCPAHCGDHGYIRNGHWEAA